tara:strand:- start:3503 stop:4219 length:717 start_codon:yes stop_codon:yes gene_type:complete
VLFLFLFASMIKLKNVTKSFKDKKALDNLSLNVNSGEIYGLLGANGAGKSTALNLLLGFLDSDSGSIEISHDKKLVSRDMIGYIPENVNLYPYLSGIENLDYFCKISGLSLNSIKLSELLNECGLENDAHNKKTSEYSKGMRQKVGIAIALAKNAKIYLLDEPASGLDPMASNELSVILKKLSTNGSTILMASHDLFRVRETCDKIGILKQGSLIKEMLSKDVTSNELEEIYLNFMQS